MRPRGFLDKCYIQKYLISSVWRETRPMSSAVSGILASKYINCISSSSFDRHYILEKVRSSIVSMSRPSRCIYLLLTMHKLPYVPFYSSLLADVRPPELELDAPRKRDYPCPWNFVQIAPLVFKYLTWVVRLDSRTHRELPSPGTTPAMKSGWLSNIIYLIWFESFENSLTTNPPARSNFVSSESQVWRPS